VYFYGPDLQSAVNLMLLPFTWATKTQSGTERTQGYATWSNTKLGAAHTTCCQEGQGYR
jgi:hypothetical protein